MIHRNLKVINKRVFGHYTRRMYAHT